MASDKDHRFLDEAGDTTFYGKGKRLVLGEEGVSKAFILGMVKFRSPLSTVREEVVALQRQIEGNAYLNGISSVQKRIANGGFYFHAKNDPPEARMLFFEFIKRLDCGLEAVAARKIPGIFLNKHHGRDAEFYADILSHLLKNKLQLKHPLVLNIASRGNSTRQEILNDALQKATSRFQAQKPEREANCRVTFNVQNQRTEPLLNVADYLCWSVQRVFERGDLRPYSFIQDKIRLVVDLYDSEKYKGSRHYYTEKNPLTRSNCLGPLPP